MVWAVSRSGIGKILTLSVRNACLQNKANRFIPPQVIAIQKANICGKAMRDKGKKRPPPYPYKEKKYGVLRSMFDDTTWRFDENSKIIVVEGPISAGKTTFAAALAEDLDMLHLPECNMDMAYINEFGFDMRKVDAQLPVSLQTFDIKNFYENPKHRNVARFQVDMYRLRYAQYIDALIHLLSTGQGVVLERCVYSDFVFLETMHKMGYISKNAHTAYYEIMNNTIGFLMKPHLVIYLDIPVNRVLERIKKRNNPVEVNSKVLTPEYLSTMEKMYKQRYLKEISTHSELLVYDWSDYGDVEVVVEDIERIDFDRFGKYDAKLQDWWKASERDWNAARITYANKEHLMTNFNVPVYYCSELVIPAEDMLKNYDVWQSTPALKYRKGYNKEMGDTGILFKTSLK